MLESLRRMVWTRKSTRAERSRVPPEESPITIVHILSASYSGSTWLNLMLGSQPDAFSIGEIFWIKELGRPYCAFHGNACEIWSNVDNLVSPELFQRLGTLTGKKWMVVNNSLGFIHPVHSAGIPTRQVHLIRDGRAVTASYLRKHPNSSVRDACRWWSRSVRYQMRQLRRSPPDHVLSVRYEELLENPRIQLQRICHWLGQPFSEYMLEYDTRAQHFIGGNLGTLSMVARAQDLPAPTEPPDTPENLRTPNWGLEHYENQDVKSYTDNRWKTENTESDQITFDRLSGRLNRRLGYD